MPSKIPDRWLDYSKMGDTIDGTRFLPIKVPLQLSYNKSLTPESQFNPDDVLRLCKEKKLSVGLVIDLTFTKKYYSPSEFTQNNVQHEKIMFPGRQLPSYEIITHFNDIVNQFLNENFNNDKVILVHCTHGVNRTGFMICQYLIDENKMSPNEAISAFNLARGHKIERDIYLNKLHSSSITSSRRISSSSNRPNFYSEREPTSYSHFNEERRHHRHRGYPRPNQYRTYYNRGHWNSYDRVYDSRRSHFVPQHQPYSLLYDQNYMSTSYGARVPFYYPPYYR